MATILIKHKNYYVWEKKITLTKAFMALAFCDD
jgi:hypothetical protein